jgi:EEF1A lysine methyltransferase 4
MSKLHAEIEGIEWKQMDVRGMEDLLPHSIDVAFDKGTLDAMIYGSGWDPPDEVRENTGRYMREVSSSYLSIGAILLREVKFDSPTHDQLFRVLKPNATFINVTYRQPHFVKPLLNAESTDWDISVDILGGADGSFEYYGFIMTKAT